MTQADFTIANQTFPNTRTELNTSLQALATNSAGNSAPSTTFANQWWFDSDDNKLYMRNKDNDAWVEILTIGATSDDVQSLFANVIAEGTSATGVTVDGVLLKDGGITTTSTINGIAIKYNITNFPNSLLISNDGNTGTLNDAGNNTGIGDNVFDALTSGDQNTAVGANALDALTSGLRNTGIGSFALTSTIDGDDNVAVGDNALDGNTTGNRNIAVGRVALANPDTENDNVGVGHNALAGAIAGGEFNVAVGNFALDGLTSGDNNVAVGYNAGGALNTGGNNTAIGYQAASAVTTASENVYIGRLAGGTGVGTSAYNVMIGNEAGEAGTSVSEATFVGFQAGTANTTGSNVLAMGYLAYDAADTENHNLAIGTHALGGSVAGGEYNVAVGNYSLDALTSADHCTAVGYDAGTGVTEASGSTFFGYQAGKGTTTGQDNVFIGKTAGYSNTTGGRNIGVGFGALYNADGEQQNIAIGYSALGVVNSGGEFNTAIGNEAADAITSADFCVAVGYQSLTNCTTGGNNIAVGRLAGDAVVDEDYTVCIGHGAGDDYIGAQSIMLGAFTRHHSDGDNEANAICIGYNVNTGRGNQVHLGNTSVTAIKGQVSFGTYSDERIKRDIVDTDLGLEFVNKLKPRKFKRKDPEEYADLFGEMNKAPIKDDEKENVFDGLIAQEVEAVCNELGVSFSGHEVSTSQGNKQSIQYETLTMPLIKAVQELSAQVTTLQQELKTIKGE